MRKQLISLVFFLPWVLCAQINESDTLKLKAKLSVTGFWQGGNVETIIFRAQSDLSFKPWDNWVFKTENSYVYQEFGKQKADEDILSLNFLYLNPDRKIYPLVLGFFSTNFRRRIDSRYIFGAGASFQIFQKQKNWLKFSLTSEYERTNFNQANYTRTKYNGENSINTWRGTLWVSGKYHLIKNKLIATHQSYFQPSIIDGDNYRWRADLGLEMPLLKYVNFKINYLHTFESIVIKDQKQEDKFLTFGFTVKSFE